MKPIINEYLVDLLNNLETLLTEVTDRVSGSSELFDLTFNISDDRVNYAIMFLVASICIFIVSMLNAYYLSNESICSQGSSSSKQVSPSNKSS